MALSFEDSLKAAKAESEAAAVFAAMPAVADNASVMTLDYGIATTDENGMIAAYSGDDGNWIEHTGYKHYSSFSDANISNIDDDKNVKLHPKQFNITQEENSQYIPFEMPRYYDGYDLTKATISIHYETVTGNHGVSIPVNVTYNDSENHEESKIRFAWLADAGVTRTSGKLKFEIHASGALYDKYGNIVYQTDKNGNQKPLGYVWKSRVNEDLNVLQSICGSECDGTINLDETWVTELVTMVAKSVGEEIKNINTRGITKEEADATYALKGNYALKSDIPTIPTNVSSFVNDAGYLTAHQSLNGYATESYVDNAIANADLDKYATAEYVGDIPEADDNGNIITATNVVDYIDYKVDSVDVSEQLKDYTTKQQLGFYSESGEFVVDNETTNVKDYIDKEISSVDVSERLKGYATKEQLGFYNEFGEFVAENEATNVKQYVDIEIQNIDVSDKLGNLSTDDGAERTVEQYVKDAVSNVKVDLTGYATETYVDGKIGALSPSVSANADGISSLNSAVKTINETLAGIDKSPRVTYKATYGSVELDDGSTADHMFTLWKTENGVEEVQDRFQISGGGGGSGSNLKSFGIKYIEGYGTPLVSTVNDSVIVKYEFTGEDSVGDTNLDGVASWKVGNRVVATEDVSTGECEFDLTEYVTIGDNKVLLTITHATGAVATKAWTVKIVDVRLTSGFDDTKTNIAGQSVNFTFTPYGNIDKTVHFLLDGKEIATDKSVAASAGLSDSYMIPAQEHGSHLFEIYMTAEINGKTVESNHIVKDIIWYDESADTPVIGTIYQNFTARQYEATNIIYTVYHPLTETPTVTLKSAYVNQDGETVEEYNSNVVMSSNTETWQYKTNIIGEHTLTIVCDGVVKTLTATVEELGINVSPITSGLAFDFNPVGYSNGDENRLWSNGDINMSVSDNFDWINGGYQIDENGDQYFCVKAGTNAVINYKLFADDPKLNGKEFKVVFRTKNIRKRDTSFLSCIDSGIGLDMKVENATLYSNGGSLKSNYCEDAIIEYEFNINKKDDMMIVMSYEDGTPSTPYEYTETTSFKQGSDTAKPITIGSEDCDVFIYRMKAYSNSLTDTDIKNNFIADARNADEMIARYNRNKIYNENGKLVSTSASGDFSADALMKAAPDLRYIFIEVPQFTNDKDNKIDGCTVYFRYPNGKRPEDNWNCTGVRHRGQGTSSNLYGYAGRNIDLCMDRDESMFTWTDEEGNTVESSTITLTDTSVPTDYLNIKVNIASSENANNAQMAKRFNEYQPFLRYARKKNSKLKDTMEFHNCVVFIRETSTDASVPHREFNDTDWHFYAIGNVGDSKKTDDTRVNNKRDPKEHVVEIMDADKPLSAFPTGKENHARCPIEDWKAGNSAYDILYSNEYVYDEEGAFESFGGETYEFRYEMKNITDEQRQSNIDTWRELYKFIVTSTDEQFYSNLKNYFVVDSAVYFYLFTERYTMVDNRAKNSFWHYGKVYISNEEAAALGETEASYYIIDDDAAAINDGYRYDLTFGYDFDTALGIDNTGDFVFPYGKEDTDYYVDGDPSSNYVFRVADSVFFCRLRDLFQSEMQAMFKNREDKNAWNHTSLINQWDNAQSQFPEELWRLDYERKYYRTYLGLSIDNSIPKGIDKTFLIGKFFGRKKYARRAFETNQEVYFATKYFGNSIRGDETTFWIRGNKHENANYSLTLVPYSDMYVCVQYGSTGTPIHKKTKAGQTCVFENNSDSMDFVYIYAANYIQEVGDMSRCYIGDNNFAAATRLQKLVIGNSDSNYNNPFMKEVLVGNNPLLEHLDLRNVSGIDSIINVSGCGNLKELYAEGTNASGVIFANGGLLETAHLPKVKQLSIKNLNNIKDFAVDGYDNLETLIVENTPSINTYDIVTNSPMLKTLRLIGMNWDSSYKIEDASVFDRLLTVGGFDSSGYETDISVLTGYAHVATMKLLKLAEYRKAWNGLEFGYNTPIEQFVVTFVNHDGTVLDVQYVDEGDYAVDPTKRENNPIDTPIKDSSVSTDYTFTGWDNDLKGQVFTAMTVTAMYSESTRSYTIKYVSMNGDILQTSTGLYGENVPYTGNIPTYTSEENAYKYYLFNRWDKSGFIDGEKTVTAIFDSFKYSSGAFDGKELKDLSPVQIYALTKLTEPIDKNLNDFGMSIETGDDYSFMMGYDIDYDDIESVEIISEKTSYNGSNYLDTGIKLFDEDKDFVLAIDYKMSSENSTGATLMQCFQSSGSNGFKLSYDSSPNLIWGTSSVKTSAANDREMLVIRHKKGENKLHVYLSNLNSTSFDTKVIEKDTITHSDGATLIFGASKQDSGRIVNYGIGDIYWCKLWYKDLGEDVCEKLVGWTHENISLEVSGFYRYALHDDYTKESMMSLLATNLLSRAKVWNTSGTSAGGWANSSLNSFLNSRFYEAIPSQIKSLMKKVSVASTIGNKSNEISSSGCYVTIPAIFDLDKDFGAPYTSEVYDPNGTINFMVGNSSRKRAYADGDYASYWTRSPNVAYEKYVYQIDASGAHYGYLTPSNSAGVLIEISF